MNVTGHHKIDELYTLYRTTSEARLARRVQAVWLARRGLTCPQVIQVVGASRRTVQQWIAKYNRGGIDELLDKPRSGGPAFLNARQQEQLARRIQAGVTKKDSLCVFTGPSVEELVEREFGVLYSLRGIQRLLRRLGFSYLSPRPAHEKTDPQAQAVLKKLWRQTSLEQNGFELAKIGLWGTAESLTQHAGVAAHFQAGTQALPGPEVRGCEFTTLEAMAACAQAGHHANGAAQHHARRGGLATRAASLMVARRAKQLFQIIVRPWQIRNVVTVKQPWPVAGRP